MAPLFTLPATPPALFDLPSLTQQATDGQRHTVRAGETVFGLALRYDTTAGAIASANQLADPQLIRTGDVLTIPAGASAPNSTSGAAKRPARSTSGHTVRAGETLSTIAARHGSTVASLAKANGISPSRFIHPGQRLAVPGRTSRVEQGFDNSAKHTTSPRTSTASRSSNRDLIVATAGRYGVDADLALAIAWQESGWNQEVTSHAGAVGIMQVMPDSGRWAGSLIGRELDLRDRRDNVTAGLVIIRQLGRMAADRDEVIAAYYQGLASIREHGWYADTRQYVANVNYFRGRF